MTIFSDSLDGPAGWKLIYSLYLCSIGCWGIVGAPVVKIDVFAKNLDLIYYVELLSSYEGV